MLVKLDRKEFESMDDVPLIWTCIEPTIREIRGKSPSIKYGVSAGLTAGQRALLMFQILYGHSGNGVAEFFSHMSYLLSYKGFWTELKSGFLYFKANEMLKLLDEMEEAYDRSGTDDPEFKEAAGRLDERLFKLLPEALKSIASYIRNAPGEFVELGL